MTTDPRLVRPSWRGRTNVDALTIGCIEHAEHIVRKAAPAIAHLFTVTQGSYQGNAGDPDSGTTHRLGGAVDLDWCGHQVCYTALRVAGMFIWHRTPAQGDWLDHFHGAPIGHPYMDSRLAAQESSYLADGDGLGGIDDGPPLTPIPRPVWPWPPKEEDDMFTDQDRERLERIEKQVRRTREGSYNRDKALVELARSTAGDVAEIIKLADQEARQ